jgi:dTDP-4-amino-4,6-dideoxygalactose transaminase
MGGRAGVHGASVGKAVGAEAPQEAPPHIPFARTLIPPEAQEAASRVLSSGWVTTGPEVAAFEREFATLVGADHAVAVSSCTAALELALRALGLPRGARVATSTMTFCGAVHAIVHAGLSPVLVDIDPWTLMPTPETVARAVARVDGVEAMVVLHFAGFPAQVGELAAAAGLPLDRVVEDAAHGIGAWVGERPIGALSAATCFSFYATKNLPIGEGGMITTDDLQVAEQVRRSRQHGMSRDAWKRYLPGGGWRYTIEGSGLKANMTDLQAAIGRAQLLYLPGWQRRRDELARRYDWGLLGIPGLRTPPWPADGRHAWHLYVLQIEPAFSLGRDEVIAGLAEHGIDTSVHFIPLHHQPYFVGLLGDELADQFPVADDAFERIVSLPLHPGLTDDEVDRVCETLAQLGAA